MSSLQAIRKKCLECSNRSAKQVRECPHTECDLYNNRFGKGRGRYLKMIRKYCVWCCNGSSNEVKLCTCHDCILYNLRFGNNPDRVHQPIHTIVPSNTVSPQG